MSDLTLNDKGAGIRLLDHPTFGDVYLTTYKQGVISDVQTVDDDPITAQSFVKVKIDGGEETDFLPIYFKPKLLYWDGTDHASQDFDDEQKTYFQAWMSFRAGDEVIVQFRENVPFRVYGFWDRYPRIGEDILRIDDSSQGGYEFFISMSKQDNAAEIGSDELGPDDKPLKLLQDVEVYTGPSWWGNLQDPQFHLDWAYATPQSVRDEIYAAYGGGFNGSTPAVKS
jgi:hypothetical protein